MSGLTVEQRKAVASKGNVFLEACPGSGKTRVITERLSKEIDKVRGTPRRVACITYTNAAVEEIEQRLKETGENEDGDYCEIATIHSFCLSSIFRPFHWHFPEYVKGFKVVGPETTAFNELVSEVAAKFGKHELTYRERDDFANINIDLSGAPWGASITSGIVTKAIAEELWATMRRRGLIDFNHIIFLSLCLLRDHPHIADRLASKFAAVLVDEFQDTTDLQVEILRHLLQRKRTTFFLVGDLYQSIFGFAGARPTLAVSFSQEIGASKGTTLTGNFRSSDNVVESAETLCPRTPKMQARGKAKHFPEKPFLSSSTSPILSIVNEFLPAVASAGIAYGETAILAPWWQHLFPIARALREAKFPVVGPGARPYRRTRTFARLAEQLCAYIARGDMLRLPMIERALFKTLLELTGRVHFELFCYAGRVTALELAKVALEVYEATPRLDRWLEEVASEIGGLLHVGEFIDSEAVGTLVGSAQDMVRDMERAAVDFSRLTAEDLGLFADPDSSIKLMTLHACKGREFDAVALMHVNEGTVPNFRSNTEDEIAADRRLLYVGVTRARRLLMYSWSKGHWKDGPSRFLKSGELGLC